MIRGLTNLPEFTAGVQLAATQDLAGAYAVNAGKVAEEFLDRVVDISPVKSGRYVGSHQVTIGRRPRAPLLPASARNRDSLSAGRKVIRRWTAQLSRLNLTRVTRKHNLLFSNLLPYAERIENGWSPQAPRGVYRVAMASARRKARRL